MFWPFLIKTEGLNIMAKAGRKTKLTPEIQEQIIKYIEAGSYAKFACHAVGIGETTYYKWIRWGKKAEEKLEGEKKLTNKENEFRQFRQSIKKAGATAVIRNILIIQKAAAKTWQAAAWWLERTHYKDYGIKKQIGGTGEEPIKIEIKNEDLENQIIKQLDKIRERANVSKRKK